MRIFLAAIIWLAALASAWAQSYPYHYLSAATTNATSVKPGDVSLTAIVAVNTTTTLYYLKLYDKLTAPVCNTDPVVFTIPIPFGTANAGGGAVINFHDPLRFQKGLAFCITAAAADNDNTSAAVGVIVDFAVK